MDITQPLQQIFAEYITNPKFVEDMGLTFLILEALQQIKAVDFWSSQYKQLAALVIGGILGVIVIEPSVAGTVAGVFAGGAITVTVQKAASLATIASGSQFVLGVQDSTLNVTAPTNGVQKGDI